MPKNKTKPAVCANQWELGGAVEMAFSLTQGNLLHTKLCAQGCAQHKFVLLLFSLLQAYASAYRDIPELSYELHNHTLK